MPTLGGSPASAGRGATDKAAVAAAAAACLGAGVSTGRKAVFHTKSAARSTALSSCGARRAMLSWKGLRSLSFLSDKAKFFEHCRADGKQQIVCTSHF